MWSQNLLKGLNILPHVLLVLTLWETFQRNDTLFSKSLVTPKCINAFWLDLTSNTKLKGITSTFIDLKYQVYKRYHLSAAGEWQTYFTCIHSHVTLIWCLQDVFMGGWMLDRQAHPKASPNVAWSVNSFDRLRVERGHADALIYYTSLTLCLWILRSRWIIFEARCKRIYKNTWLHFGSFSSRNIGHCPPNSCFLTSLEVRTTIKFYLKASLLFSSRFFI